MSIRITCIKKDGGNHANPYVAISNLGWRNESTGATGRSKRDQLYEWIKYQGGQAYVLAGTSRADLVTEVSPTGTQYVKTRADSTDRDNLLKLPECP